MVMVGDFDGVVDIEVMFGEVEFSVYCVVDFVRGYLGDELVVDFISSDEVIDKMFNWIVDEVGNDGGVFVEDVG